LAGHAGDVLVVTGANWDTGDVVVTVNGTVLANAGVPTDAEVRAVLPAEVSAGPVVVRSQGRASEPSATRVCAAPPAVSSLSVSPGRDAGCPGAAGALAGLAGDTLTVTGMNWVPGEVQVLAGTAPLTPGPEGATATQVRVRLPPRLPVTPLVVSSGPQRSAPSERQVCVVAPFVSGVRVQTPREGVSCPGVDGGVAGYAGDTLVVSGGGWVTDDVWVDLGEQSRRPRAGPDGGMESELWVTLPARLPPSPVVVRPAGQDPAVSPVSVCVVQPFISQLRLEPVRPHPPCVVHADSLPGFAGDELTIEGGAWNAQDVEVELGTQVYRLHGTPDAGMETRLVVRLPPRPDPIRCPQGRARASRVAGLGGAG
jgi:hypothetical protein